MYIDCWLASICLGSQWRNALLRVKINCWKVTMPGTAVETDMRVTQAYKQNEGGGQDFKAPGVGTGER